MAGIEMRRRMILSFQRNVCMFETREIEQTLEDLQEKVAEVDRYNKNNEGNSRGSQSFTQTQTQVLLSGFPRRSC